MQGAGWQVGALGAGLSALMAPGGRQIWCPSAPTDAARLDLQHGAHLRTAADSCARGGAGAAALSADGMKPLHQRSNTPVSKCSERPSEQHRLSTHPGSSCQLRRSK
jgi:hypothetical protein